MKKIIAKLLDFLGLNYLFFKLSIRFYGPHIRVVNYHGTALNEMYNFEEHLKFYRKNYNNCSFEDLNSFFFDKNTLQRPRIIISFDDGHRSNFANALPLLEKYGFTGWFMIPVLQIDTSYDEQMNFIGNGLNKVKMQFLDGRYMMNWNELSYLTDKHVIGCHTNTHHRMSITDTFGVLTHEIVDSKRFLEKKLNRSIEIFCWVGGEEHTYTKAASELIKKTDYKYCFMTNTFPIFPNTLPLQLQRTNIESDYPLSLVKFQLGPLMDIFYYPKRKRVEKLTR
jgi:peptidoglycan/xylan/chitin deacetylase (PgdA/CDA1 family)